MEELHLTKKDFKLEWYSGQGAGGQHRNKHQNCCRITHLESGITENGTSSRSRVTNQREAFTKLANRVISWYAGDKPDRRTGGEVIRNYHAVRNEVHDKASGEKRLYREVVTDGNLSELIEARRLVMGENNS